MLTVGVTKYEEEIFNQEQVKLKVIRGSFSAKQTAGAEKGEIPVSSLLFTAIEAASIITQVWQDNTTTTQ